MRRVLIPATLQPVASSAGDSQFTLSGQSMGTTWSVRYLHTAQHAQAEILALIQQALDLVIQQMSTWQPDSSLSRYNTAVAGSWHPLPQAFYRVMACALEIASSTQGAFDPTIGPLVNLWGFGPHGSRTSPPTAEAIAATHADCGWQRLQLDHARQQLFQPGNAYVDLSGIAKGYAVDHVAQALQTAGIHTFLVEIGGELYGAGIKPDGQPWWVALETHPDWTTVTESIVALHGLAVATSGDYRRYFEHGGQHYAHTIDPRSGYPLDRRTNPLVSVTVLHSSCMVADALATAFTVMGVEPALAYADQHGIAALLITQTDAGHTETLSATLSQMLEE